MNPRERQKIINIVIAVIVISFLFRGVARLLPLLILAAIIYFAWRAYKQYATTKQNPSMIDHETVQPQMPSFKNVNRALVPIGVLIIVIIILSLTVTVVPAGNVGVMDFFGKVSNRVLAPGIQLKTPASRIIMFSTRTQDYTMSSRIGEGTIRTDDSISALTKEGLTLGLDITVLYHLNKESAAEIYQTIGINYEEKILRPSIRSVIREIIAQYKAVDLYSEKREVAASAINDVLKKTLEKRGITIEEVLLRDVTLPDKLANSIEEKLKAEQEAQRFDFVLDKEEKEAERKRIEARGQRDAQSIINESLTTRYLQFLYIRELKDREGTIYVPTNPQNGLPLFRGL